LKTFDYLDAYTALPIKKAVTAHLVKCFIKYMLNHADKYPALYCFGENGVILAVTVYDGDTIIKLIYIAQNS
jgi:hypothetical protein